jgi:hypothetical protein
MRDAPETIWVCATDIEPHAYGQAHISTTSDGDATKYRRADLPTTDDKIAARLHECVKPLEWIECRDGTLHDPDCQYELETDGGFWRVTKGVTGGTSYICHCSTLEAAKAAAQAHYAAQIMAALDLSAFKPVDDPRVQALVAAATELEKQAKKACNLGAVTGPHWTYLGLARMKMATALTRFTNPEKE